MRNIDKKTELQLLALSLSLGTTVFFFSPFELLINNQAEFIVDPKHIVIALLLSAIAAVAAGILVLNLVLIISKTAYRIVASLLFGLLLGGYVQMLFFNGKMTFLNNVEGANAADNPLFDSINFVIFLLLFLTPAIITVFRLRDEKKQKVAPAPPRVILLVSAAIFLMQLTGAVTSALTHRWLKGDTEYPNALSYFSYEGVTNLSREDNIIVFLVDRFAGKYMDSALACYPEVSDVLSGFTYYRDCVSCYPCTFPSVPQLVTGVEYGRETWVDYLTRAWSGDNLLQTLRDNGYSVNVSLDGSTTFVGMRDVAAYADNVVVPTPGKDGDSDLYRMNYLGKGGIVPVFLNYSMAKLVPTYFKDMFLRNVGMTPTERFVVFADSLIERQPSAVSNTSDLAFLRYLTEAGVRADNPKKAFVFVHLNGVHNPKPVMADLAPDRGAAATDLSTATARGAIELLGTCFAQMKALGIYDSSTVIVLADHGSQGLDIERMRRENSTAGGVSGYISTLLIKPKNAPDAPLIINEEAQLSNQFIPATVLEAAGIDHAKYGVSVQDVLRDKLSPERRLRLVMFTGFFIPTVPDEYGVFYINGPAHDDNSWTLGDAP